MEKNLAECLVKQRRAEKEREEMKAIAGSMESSLKSHGEVRE